MSSLSRTARLHGGGALSAPLVDLSLDHQGALRATMRWFRNDKGSWPSPNMFPKLDQREGSWRAVLGYNSASRRFVPVTCLYFTIRDGELYRVKDYRSSRSDWPAPKIAGEPSEGVSSEGGEEIFESNFGPPR